MRTGLGGRRKVWVFGMKIDPEMKRQIICAYLGLCVLTVISVTNFYLIRQQNQASIDAEHILQARYRRQAELASRAAGASESRLGRAYADHAPAAINDGKDAQLDSYNAADVVPADSGGGEPVKNIYYVKVHKAGSTTLQNIMFRFAMKHNLRVAIFNRQWGMPYPDYALPEFLYENLTDPGFQKYNMICDHSVYDRDSVAPYMEDYESVAILREPYSHLVSAFDFWGLAKRFRLHKTRDPLREFLTKDPNQYKDITPHFNRTKNMQAYHFGHVDYHDNSEESIDKLIQHVDKHFKIVMLREKFEESLILLRRLFKWKFEDILYMDQFVNTQPKAKIRTERDDEVLRETHKAFAPVDYRLYDHFSKKLDNMINTEPNDLMGEVLYFKETNRKIAEFCENVCMLFPFETIKNLTVADILPKLSKGIVFPKNKWHDDIHLTYENCAYMKFWTYQYHNAFRVKQLPSTCPEKKGVGPPVDQPIFDSHDAVKYGYCDTDNHVLFQFPLDVFKEIVLDVPMHPVINAKIAKAPKCKGRG